jgi:hypothetical protein
MYHLQQHLKTQRYEFRIILMLNKDGFPNSIYRMAIIFETVICETELNFYIHLSNAYVNFFPSKSCQCSFQYSMNGNYR